jgi:hypothetical protein
LPGGRGDLAGCVAAIGVLYTNVEKLGLKFRVLRARRKLRDPIGEVLLIPSP